MTHGEAGPLTKPIIRTWEIAEDRGKAALWLRAFVVSGFIHLVLITTFIFVHRILGDATVQAKPEQVTSTRLDEPPEKLTEDVAPNAALDSDIVAAEEAAPDADLLIDAPVVENEPAGLPSQDDPAPVPSLAGSEASNLAMPGSLNSEDLGGVIARGELGAGGPFGGAGPLGRSGLPREVQKRLESAGGKSGQVHITLVWNNFNDLDLHLIDPSGERIFYGNRIAKMSSGQLDVDRNAGGEMTMKPIENIFFPQGEAPKGKYQVLLHHFANHNSPDPTYYEIYVKVNDRRTVFRGKIAHGEPMRVIYEFTQERRPTVVKKDPIPYAPKKKK
jgi:hypothetical protein